MSALRFTSAFVLIRPEDISVDGGQEAAESREMLVGTVKEINYHGDSYKLEIAVGDDILKVKVASERRGSF